MPWEMFSSKDGIYQVNWDGIGRIIRSYVRSRAMVQHSVVAPTERRWVGPDLYSLEIDWPKVKAETLHQTDHELMKFYSGAQSGMQPQINRLVSMMETAKADHDKIRERLQSAQAQTMANVEQSVRLGQLGIQSATIVRDACFDFLMVGATYLTGGAAATAGAAFEVTPAAAGFMTLGAGLKGAATYQDTGKVGNAVGTFSTNLLFGALDLKAAGIIGKAAKTLAGKIGLGMVWAKAKAVASVPFSVIEGKRVGEGLSQGMVKMAAATPGAAAIEGLKDFLKPMDMEPWAIPVEVALNLSLDKAGDMAYDMARQQPERTAAPRHTPPSTPQQHLMDAVLYDRTQIEKTAVRQIASRAA